MKVTGETLSLIEKEPKRQDIKYIQTFSKRTDQESNKSFSYTVLFFFTQKHFRRIK